MVRTHWWRQILLLAEPDEQSGPVHRDRWPAGRRADSRHRGWRAGHFRWFGRFHGFRCCCIRTGWGRYSWRAGDLSDQQCFLRSTGRYPDGFGRRPDQRFHRHQTARERYHRHLGTLAAFAGFAFLLAPDGKPIGVVTQPAFTWLAQGRFLTNLPIPDLGGTKWVGIPVLTVIFLIVTILFHVLMRYTTFGRSIYALGGNPTAARLAGINLDRLRIIMFVLSGSVAGLTGVLLTSRTTSGNPVNGT